MHPSPRLTYIFPPCLLRIATVLLCTCLLAVLGGQEADEPFIADDVFTTAQERSQGMAGGQDSRSAPRDGEQVAGSLVRMIVGLALVIAIAFAIAWLVRRSGLHRRLPGQRGEHLAIIENVSIGPKRAVTLLRVGGSYVVVGHSEQAITALATMTSLDDPTATPLTAPQPQPSPHPAAAKEASAVASVTDHRQDASAEASPAPVDDSDQVQDFRQRLQRLLGGERG